MDNENKANSSDKDQTDKLVESNKASKTKQKETGDRIDISANAIELDASKEKHRWNRYMWIMLAILLVLGIVAIVGSIIVRISLPSNVGVVLEGDELQEVVDRNSPLIDYVQLSPNATFPREGKIQKITIHHMGGSNSLEGVGELFQERDRQSSSNYAIDVDGNVGLYVEEANRAWTSSSRDNDNVAVTIEVANDGDSLDWYVGDTAYNKMIDLIVDVCERNGITELVYTGDSSGNLTYHHMFNSKTDCPGEYLINKMDDIASEVNERLKKQD